MPIIAPITFKAQGFDYLLGTASEAVTWEFKNANRIDFMPADGKTYLDRGSLTVVDSTTAEYRRPTKLPSESDLTAADSVIIRATSVADPNASATAIATITPKVVVEIFDSIEKIASISTAATVAEVGKIQFFPQVTPTVIGNTSVSWSVNDGQGHFKLRPDCLCRGESQFKRILAAQTQQHVRFDYRRGNADQYNSGQPLYCQRNRLCSLRGNCRLWRLEIDFLRPAR
jgi:hypothetical protein